METQSYCLYAIREYLNHTDFNEIAKTIAFRDGLVAKFVEILDQTGEDYLKVQFPLYQIIKTILSKSETLAL